MTLRRDNFAPEDPGKQGVTRGDSSLLVVVQCENAVCENLKTLKPLDHTRQYHDIPACSNTARSLFHHYPSVLPHGYTRGSLDGYCACLKAVHNKVTSESARILVSMVKWRASKIEWQLSTTERKKPWIECPGLTTVIKLPKSLTMSQRSSMIYKLSSLSH